MIEETISHYRILQKLGEGGMGEVYLAEDTLLNRKVAIKFLPADSVADMQAKRRLIREAQAAAMLDHPNICPIHEVGEEDGRSFIVMQYVEGETLADLIRRKPLELPQFFNIAAQVAGALVEAHSHQIIHRDIKPQNIVITPRGQAKVLDFGLARVIRELDVLKSEAETQSLLTEPGMIVGTVAYISPEQAAGKPVDARSDIFSFGAVLYEMVTRHRAFLGDSQMAILAAVLNQEPTPLPAKVPNDLVKIILRCLRKDPSRRYQTMADLKVALEDVREESGSVSKVHAPSRRPWILAALLSMLVVAAFLAWQPWRAPESTEPPRAVPLTTLTGVARYPSFSPDGNYVAFTWSGPKQDNPDIYVQQIGSGSPARRTTDPGNDYNPVWSPDGRSIAFLRSQSDAGKSELRLIPSLGGTERKVAEIRVRGGIWITPPYLAWCPDSDCLVVTDSPGEGKPDALFVVLLETGEKRPLTNPQPPVQADTNPAVSPDGNWLVFRRTNNLFNGELYRLALGRDLTAAGEPQRLTPATLDANHPTWMPDSKEILFSVFTEGLRRLVVVGEEPGESTPARLPFVGEDGLTPVVSRPQHGRPPRLVYLRSFTDENIWRVETSAPGATASSPPVVFISSTRGEWFPQFSPDGRRVVFSSNRSGEGAIWLADADGSNTTRLATLGAFATGSPRWSPEGDMIAFHSNPEGQGEVYVVPAAGGKPRNLTSNPATDSFPSYSRDGRWIYFSSNRTGEHRIWKIPASGGDAVKVTDDVGYLPIESPDGAYLYYVETMDKPSPLWRLPTSGGVPVNVLEGVLIGNFVVREGGIYYIDKPTGQGGVHYLDLPSGETRLQYFNLATRRSTTMARNLGNVNDPFLTVSPDGRTILYSRTDSSVNDLMLVENFR